MDFGHSAVELNFVVHKVLRNNTWKTQKLIASGKKPHLFT